MRATERIEPPSTRPLMTAAFLSFESVFMGNNMLERSSISKGMLQEKPPLLRTAFRDINVLFRLRLPTGLGCAFSDLASFLWGKRFSAGFAALESTPAAKHDRC